MTAEAHPTEPTKTKPKWRRETNPLLAKELRGRMRKLRTFLTLTGHLLLLGCFVEGIYILYTSQNSAAQGVANMTDLGKTLFYLVAIAEIYMVTFIPPAFTAGAISGERERKTYELLRTTLLSARQLVMGKMYSSLGFIVLLILSALPLESMAFAIGGVTLSELVVAQVLILVTAFAFASIGMAVSAFTRTTLVSTVITYVVSLMVNIAFPMFILIVGGVVATADLYRHHWLLQAAMVYVSIIGVSLSPISAAIAAEVMLEEENTLLLYWQSVDGHHIPVLSPWLIYVCIYLAFSAVLLLVAVMRVRHQEKK